MEMLGPDGPPLLKIAQLKIEFVCILPNFLNNLSDFANFCELKNFVGVSGGGGAGGGAQNGSLRPGRQNPRYASPGRLS